jgi:cell fate regulator YaaT (PSP1 superfamily)
MCYRGYVSLYQGGPGLVAEVVGVVFPGGVKVYHFDPAGLELSRGDRVVVQTSSGPEIGQVVEPPHTVDDAEIVATLKKVARVATGKDLEAQAASEDLRRRAMDTCRELIATHSLDMKLVGAEVGFGGEKITFSFFSEERVDFRGLVADLAKALKMRVELRQVGAREEARMVGGLGPCGRGLCCTMFAGDDDPVSIRMAKEQNLPLNPTKISGLCGRLMCCLKYEQDQYVSFRKEAPAKGTPVTTPTGDGVVSGYVVTKDAITVRMEDGSVTDVRLCTCQCQKDGSLLVVPEEKPSVRVLWMDSPGDVARLEAEDVSREGLPVVEAEVILGENGEPVEVLVAESTRPARSRRRRRGRGRGQAREQGPAGDTAGAGAAGRSGAQPRGAGQQGDANKKAVEGTAGQGRSEQSGDAGASGGAGGRSRRRRRPRRPGGGVSSGATGSGAGTAK